MADIPDLIALVTEDDSCVAINPDTIARVAPRTLGGSTVQFKDGTFIAVQKDFEELTGVDPEAAVEEAKEAREEKAKVAAKEKADAEAKAKKEAEAA
jgi:hypothetical protein